MGEKMEWKKEWEMEEDSKTWSQVEHEHSSESNLILIKIFLQSLPRFLSSRPPLRPICSVLMCL